MIEFKFLKELMLIRQAIQKILIFLTIGIFLRKGFKYANAAMNLRNIGIFKIKSADYCCIIRGISKIEALFKL